MDKRLIAFGLPVLLVAGLVGWLIGHIHPLSGQPITIMDGYLYFTAYKAFNSWPNEAAVTMIHPPYTSFSGVDLVVDDQISTVCTKPAETCQIKIRWEDPNTDTVFFDYVPNGGAKMLTLTSTKNTFDTYTGYSTAVMRNPDTNPKNIARLTVVVAGTPLPYYTPKVICIVRINVE